MKPNRHSITALLLAVLFCDCAGKTDEKPEPEPVIPDFHKRSIPSLGDITVVPVNGEQFGRKLLAVSLQGVVNRSEVRLYLVDGDQDAWRWWEMVGEADSQRHWLDHYAAEYGLVVGSDISLDTALQQFAKEAAGYILASEEEPWTVNAATTLAGLRNGLAATEDEAPLLESLGLPLIEDLRGRWPSAQDCIRDTFETLYPEANQSALAIVYPFEYRLRDFLIQNKVFVVFGRPNGEASAWEAVEEVLEQTPPDQPVFGYLSLDGLEEYLAVLAISSSGKFINPSDNASNLSVHSAIPAEQPPTPTTKEVDCAPGTLRAAIAISDGDNMSMPLNRFISDRYWLSSERGNFPMGWSLSPALIDLAPGVAAYYASGRTECEELVGALGIGYAHPTKLPAPTFFMSATFTALKRQGMTSIWFIDPNLDSSDAHATLWEEISRGHTEWGLMGVLVGFINITGSVLPQPFWTTSGMPVVFNANTYSDKPEDIEQCLHDALGAFRAGGSPDVVLISACVWENDFGGLAEVMRNLAGEKDLTFMTPSQLLACMEK